MLAKIITISLAIDILLICLEGSSKTLARHLPVGGSHLAQLGLVLGIAVALAHLWDTFGG